MLLSVLGLAGASFILSFVLTLAMKHWALRMGFVDRSGHRKIHVNPKLLGGGVAIFWAIELPLLGILVTAWSGLLPDTAAMRPYIGGAKLQTPLALAILVALFLIHLIGLWDDKKSLGPFVKLIRKYALYARLVLDQKQWVSSGLPSLLLRPAVRGLLLLE